MNAPQAREIIVKPRLSDRIFRWIVTGGGLMSLLILGLIAGFLAFRGFEVFQKFGLGFITNFSWDPGDPDNGIPAVLGIGSMLVGTIVTSLIALVIALPISVGAALYLTYYAPNFVRKPMTLVVDLMAAIPSVVYGIWGFFVLMPHAVYWAKLIHKYLGWIPIFDLPVPVFERSPFIAGLVLAIMIIPIVTSVAREIFSQTPLDRIQAAYALGATRWAMIKSVALPFGSSGIVGGAMLGLGRAFGETVAVFTVLNIVFKANFQILFGMGGNIASMIVLKWGEASPIETRALLASGFVLFLLTLGVNAVADFIVKRALKSGK